VEQRQLSDNRERVRHPTWGSVIKLTQTISPNLLNETSLNVNGNSISITPAGIYTIPSGWTQAGYFPAGNNLLNRMPSVVLGRRWARRGRSTMAVEERLPRLAAAR